ncbi:hypothetical protein GCM10027435_11120 [Haloparvum alkalitolerans]
MSLGGVFVAAVDRADRDGNTQKAPAGSLDAVFVSVADPAAWNNTIQKAPAGSTAPRLAALLALSTARCGAYVVGAGSSRLPLSVPPTAPQPPRTAASHLPNLGGGAAAKPHSRRPRRRLPRAVAAPQGRRGARRQYGTATATATLRDCTAPPRVSEKRCV